MTTSDAGMPDHAFASVFCMDVSHPKKHALVAMLDRASETGEWEPRWDHTAEDLVLLEGDVVIENAAGIRPGWQRAVYVSASARRHLEMTCPLCGFKLSVRGERLDNVLDECWERADAAGVIRWRENSLGLVSGGFPVPLAVLAAKV